MTPVVGVDIGNATTEVVLGACEGAQVRVVGAERAPTRRGKGSPESLEGAARLVRRLERRHGLLAERAVVAPLRPVETGSTALPEERIDTGRLWIAASNAGTAGGVGFAAGRPVLLGEEGPGEEPVVVVVRASTGYAAAAARLSDLAHAGRLQAVLLEDDEAVLVANRLPVTVPVLDEVCADDVLAADLVAVEVAPPGRPLQSITDPFKLRAALGLSEEELADAARLAPLLYDATNAAVALGGAPAQLPGDSGWIEVLGAGRLPFRRGHQRLVGSGVGAARAYAAPPGLVPRGVDDLWTVDLAAVAGAVQARRAATGGRPMGIAALHASAPYTDPAPELSSLLGFPVQTVGSEAAAARAGALSTPAAAGDVVVVDLGGGTIDAVSARREVVAAGAGDLVSTAVAALIGTTAAAAEWVKRGPAARVEDPQVLLSEDGTRSFLDRPAARDTLGRLVVEGPAGLLPFSSTLAPGEWRALRLRLKTEVVGGNVARALRTLDESPQAVLVVGGSAGDDEVLAAVAGALPSGTVIARGNVAGTLGHRYAVAYGLLLTGCSDPAAADPS